MEQENYLDQTLNINSFTGLNISDPQIQHTRIEDGKIIQKEKNQQVDFSGTIDEGMNQSQKQVDKQFYGHQSLNQSPMQSRLSQMDDSVIQSQYVLKQKQVGFEENKQQENSIQYSQQYLNKAIEIENSDEIDNQQIVLLGKSNNNILNVLDDNSFVDKDRRQISSQIIGQDVWEQVKQQQQVGRFWQFWQRNGIQESTIMIRKKGLEDGSVSKAFIQREFIDHIQSNKQNVFYHTMIGNNNSNFTLNDDTNSKQIEKLNNKHQKLSSQLGLNQIHNQDSQQIQYDDNELDKITEELSVNLAQQKRYVFQKRKQQRQKQQLIIPRVQRAQNTQIYQQTYAQKEYKRELHLPPLKLQNLNVLNEMFNSNQHVIKKHFKGLSRSRNHYNIFYIDQTKPLYNRYILDLSVGVSRQNAEKKRLILQEKKRQKYLEFKINQQHKLVQKVKSRRKHQNQIPKCNQIQSLEMQKNQNIKSRQFNEDSQKLNKTKNKKKAMKKEAIKQHIQQKIKNLQGCSPQQIKHFKIDMKILTSVVWQHVVFLSMKNCQINDEKIIIFVKSAEKFSNLVRMEFSQNMITDKGFTYFITYSHKFQKLFDIFFQKNLITNLGLKTLSYALWDFYFYKRIYLSENFIDDEGYITFFSNGSYHPNLVQLRFDGNDHIHKPMTCQGLKSLSRSIIHFVNLKQIHFTKNLISDQGLEIFSEKMQQLIYLGQINFGVNNMTSKGFSVFLKHIWKLQSIRKVHFNDNNIEKIPQYEMKKLFMSSNTLVFMSLKNNPLEKDKHTCFFLVNTLFSMYLRFKLLVFLNTPYTIGIYFKQINEDFNRVKCEFKKAIQLINGNDSGVVEREEKKHKNKPFVNKIKEKKMDKYIKKDQNEIRFLRLTSIKLSDQKLTSHDWSLLVQNINSLPELQHIDLDKNKIESISIEQLDHLQKFVSQRNRKQSKILKISLVGNTLDRKSLQEIQLFINKTQDCRVFIILKAGNNKAGNDEKCGKKTQFQQYVNINNQYQRYQQRHFEIKVQSSLQFGLLNLTVNKSIQDIQYLRKFQKMLKQIVDLCDNQIKRYQRVKLMIVEYFDSIKLKREYGTKKDQIDRLWQVVLSFCTNFIEKWCTKIKSNQKQFQLDQNEVKGMFQKLYLIKKQKIQHQGK